ncbi:thioredoxin domain-containing protein [Lignipirellula cremea]|uniref:Glycosyl Hydrolase Family 88 n=1 Tax=Lignipirellula cremea TaxID=2528010 RepID=A0A518DP24_9BACT|nr:thioredoxin domain-containing protein [Lignipirellula cremea]QDU93592.1 Glycosyl Hydrolase Family 88 [Lignipirellula cremea]
MPNRLAQESSPYLLQHANNPVDWYPWGPEAIAKAKSEEKPIFLSVGYSACHWCHVMEHESFENEQIAARLNADFVAIKVDREERPDLDQIYMQAVQLITRSSGGWPLSAFLTPDLQPFFGGTYWPPTSRYGRPGFNEVLDAVMNLWQNRRADAVEQAGQITEYLSRESATPPPDDLGIDLLRLAVGQLEKSFDFTNGGFGASPKFPHPMDVQLLFRLHRRIQRPGLRDMAVLTLNKMAAGGIYDHLAGGFARYSVDERWLVPHFEKMLYDNALLAEAYLDGFLVTGNADYARIARETIDYVLNEMTDENGGFHSTEDADSEGEEGKFYVWTPDEIHQLLGPEAGARFCRVYDVTDRGNFEGKNILNLPQTIEEVAAAESWELDPLLDELADSRATLLAARAKRVRPGKDDKVLVSWNALMISTLAKASDVLGNAQYAQAAVTAAEFLLEKMTGPDRRLLHAYRLGEARLDAYLDDYAYLMNALVSLYEATFDERWIEEAVTLAEIVLKHFSDARGGGFFFTADDHEQLIARQKDDQDSSTPSGNSMAALAFLRLGKLCGDLRYTSAARQTLEALAPLLRRAPTAAGQAMIALDMWIGPTCEIAIIGDPHDHPTGYVLDALRRRYLPNRVLACRRHPEDPEDDVFESPLDPLFAGKTAAPNEGPAVYICENFACQAPVYGEEAVLAAWDRLAKAKDAPK